MGIYFFQVNNIEKNNHKNKTNFLQFRDICIYFLCKNNYKLILKIQMVTAVNKILLFSPHYI